jgi:hypothetical protein
MESKENINIISGFAGIRGESTKNIEQLPPTG